MFMNACSNIFLKHILQQFKSTLVITKNVIYLSIYAPKEKKLHTQWPFHLLHSVVRVPVMS